MTIPLNQNRKTVLYTGLLLAAAIILLVLYSTLSRRTGKPIQAQLISQPASPPSDGFMRVTEPRSFDFPFDHGPHNEYQTEWWYYTGNLQTGSGQHFGYQLTFFRRALLPPNETPIRSSDWAANHVYLAHFALSDVASNNYFSFERFSRGAAGLAGAEALPFQVWLEDWTVAEIEQSAQACESLPTAPCEYHLFASQDGITVDLVISDQKGPILQGDQGFSPKGPEPGQASYYYSQPRLATKGSIQVDKQNYLVSGHSWMDHEFSTSALSADQIGWDWFSIQLDDQSELMLFQIRKEDGTIDSHSSAALIASDGSTTQLIDDEFDIQVEKTWRSPHSGAKYPSRWKINIPSANLELIVVPYITDQELNVSYSYWEGAVSVQATRGDQLIQGNGYVELTGYSASMAGEF